MVERNGQQVDKILLFLNPTGRYQMFQMVISLLGFLPAATQLLGNVFICDHAPHKCAGSDNDTAYIRSLAGGDNSSSVVYGECNITVWTQNGSRAFPCLFGNEYEQSRDMSAISQFDLVCEHKHLKGLAQSLVIAGQGIGALISTPISDRLGRKMVLIASNLGLLSCGMLIAFTPNASFFLLFKFLVGIFQQATICNGITFVVELFPISDRRWSAIASGLIFSAGVMSMPLIGFLLRDVSWRYTQGAFSAYSILVLLQIWYLDESLRWLMANGKEDKAEEVLQRAAETNGRQLSEVMQIYKECTQLAEDEDELLAKKTSSNGVGNIPNGVSSEVTTNGIRLSGISSNGRQSDDTTADLSPSRNSNKTTCSLGASKVTKKLSVLDLFRFKRMFVNAIIMWFAWFTVALGFFVLYLTATELAGDPYLNFFLTACMELPSALIFYLCLNRWGRKWTTFFMFSLLSVGLVLTGVFKNMGDARLYEILAIVASLIATIGATSSFDAVFQYTPEMFPTNIRNQAVGVSSFIGRIGGMLAPFIGILAEKAIWAPGVLIGVMASIVSLLMIFLPETKGRELPQTIEDLNSWYTKDNEIKVCENGKVNDRSNGTTKLSIAYGDV